MKKPKILLLSPIFLPPTNPEGIVNVKFALAALDAGWDVDCICLQYKLDINMYPSLEEKSSVWMPVERITHPIKLSPDLLNTKNLFARLCNVLRFYEYRVHNAWTGFAVNKGIELNTAKKYDFLLSRAGSFDTHVFAMILSKRTGVPWIANWNDPAPYNLNPPPYGQGPYAKISPRIKRNLQRIAMEASWHTFPSERLMKYFSSLPFLPEAMRAKSSIIPHIALKRFQRSSSTGRDIFSLCYAGNLRPPRRPDVFLDGVKRFLDKNKVHHCFRVRFLGDHLTEIQRQAQSLGIEDIIVIDGAKSYEESLDVLSGESVLVIIEAPVDEGIFLPSKLIDYVQVGHPILALSPSTGTLKDIFSCQKGGIAVDCQSAPQVAQAIETLFTHWKENNLNEVYNSAELYNLFDEERVLKQYIDLFNQISSTKKFG